MISHKDMLNIVHTEGIEYGGLPEVPGHHHGGKASFHAAKRSSRESHGRTGRPSATKGPTVSYKVLVVKTSDGKLKWAD
jgi:hypothetical protein